MVIVIAMNEPVCWQAQRMNAYRFRRTLFPLVMEWIVHRLMIELGYSTLYLLSVMDELDEMRTMFRWPWKAMMWMVERAMASAARPTPTTRTNILYNGGIPAVATRMAAVWGLRPQSPRGTSDK